jgi:acetylornithine deacetylase/succinyl-diaminopimelate desuccinylase-like protein
LSGLGARNMKGGVAAAAEALLALAEVEAELPGTVSLAAVAGESEKAPPRTGPRLRGSKLCGRRRWR